MGLFSVENPQLKLPVIFVASLLLCDTYPSRGGMITELPWLDYRYHHFDPLAGVADPDSRCIFQMAEYYP